MGGAVTAGRAPVERPSPNHGPRRAGVAVDMLVLHYTGMPDAASALDRLCDPRSRVSAHYLVEEDGTVWRLVPEERRAWHAGAGEWAGDGDVNGRSIGIELVNPGHEHGYRPFPEAQMAALERVAVAAVERHAIPPCRVVGHADVAPTRKRDPGELFDWARLARGGVGVWPAVAAVPPRASLAPGDRGAAVVRMQSSLSAYGYGVQATGEYDAATEAAVAAFQRHFRPRAVDGIWDAECDAVLCALLRAAAPAAD